MPSLPRQPRAFVRLRRGFTLLELLLVAALISIFAAGTVAAVYGRARQQALRLAARDMASALAYAMAEARADGAVCRVAFDPASPRRFRLERWVADSGQFEPVSGVAGRWHVFGEAVTVRTIGNDAGGEGTQATALEFSPDGRGFAGEVVLSCPDQVSIRLGVLPLAGQVCRRQEQEEGP